MNERVMMSHGSGGRQARELIEGVFAAGFGMTGPLTDSAVLECSGSHLAFTTDSFVVDPLFFPGGDIGKLAVCGTVNDLAVSGAVPAYISASFIIEEGFLMKDLERIAASMAAEAKNAAVQVVTGDTKVVEKGKCDRLFITTAGTGFISESHKNIGNGSLIENGDKLIINGSLGEHSVAILAARNNMSFRSSVTSDCASLNHLVRRVLDKCSGVHFMRDLTRGGLAAVLNELALMTGKGIIIDEMAVPVDEAVRGLCEILGFDPLCLANEGKILFVANEKDCAMIMEILRADPLGRNASVVGEITKERGNRPVLKTLSGGMRVIDMPSGTLLPRIC